MNKKIVIYEDDTIKVETTGKYYDFIATVDNKTSQLISIETDDETECGMLIEPNDWIGLLANSEGDYILECFMNGNFTVSTR